MAPDRAGTAPRSLAEDLRRRSDDVLVDLLRARPDLAVPIPGSLSVVAHRAAARSSVQRAVDGLDAAALQVLEVVAVLEEPVSPATVTARWGADAREPLARLRALALIWGGPRTVRPARAVLEVLGPFPAGLGPPLGEALGRRSPQRIADLAADLGLPGSGDPERTIGRLSEHLGDPDTVAALLGDAPDGARTLVDRLAWGPPLGRVEDADRPVRSGTASSPVEWLLAHGLLAVADPGHVVLPREIGLALRGGRVHREPSPAPPTVTGTTRSARLIASASVGASTELVRHVEELARAWASDPPAVLRAGGLGVRELRRAGTLLGLDDAATAVVVELAHAAGLVAEDGEADPRWAPTPAFDVWRGGSVGQRWASLASAWLDSDRATWLIGTRDARDTPRAALGRELMRAGTAQLRRSVLAELPVQGGQAPDPASLRERLTWYAPRRWQNPSLGLSGALDAVLAEAALLGITGAGALGPHGRALLGASATNGADAVEAAGEALDEQLPDPVDHVLIQADLTAVAPGPLQPDLEEELALLADVESRGAATVYRFSSGSLRRAFDAGWTGDEIVTLLRRRSRTGVPQPLEYLIGDLAQRHARIRVGAAAAFVRAEDQAMLEEILADRRAQPLRLRRLAPTVLAAQAPPDQVLRVLRELGLAPAAESVTGDLVLHRAGTGSGYRTPPRTRPDARGGPPAPSEQTLAGLVRALREADAVDPGEDGASAGPHEPEAAPGAVPMIPATPPAVTLRTLRTAAASGSAVWIAFTDGEGRTARRLVRPLLVDGGHLRARDLGGNGISVVPVHRIIAAAPRDAGRRQEERA